MTKTRKILGKSLISLVGGVAGLATLANPDAVQPVIDAVTNGLGPNLYEPQPLLTAASYAATIAGGIGTIISAVKGARYLLN
jgi:hypothetical protein